MDNDIIKHPYPEACRRFEKAWDKTHPGSSPGRCHNVYHIECFDEDGNLTNESFAVNCMTDYAFDQMYNQMNSNNSFRVYVGDGCPTGVSIDPSDQRMLHALSTNYLTISEASYSLSSNRYDPETNGVISIYYFGKVYMDYRWWTDSDHDINEIGISAESNINKLWYHSQVYDENGNPTTITKRVNERMYISIYAKMFSPTPEIINKLWNKGVYALFNEWFFGGYSAYSYSIYWAYSYYRKLFSENYTSYGRLPFVQGNQAFYFSVWQNIGEIVDHVYKSTKDGMTLSWLLSYSTDYIDDFVLTSDNGYPGNITYGTDTSDCSRSFLLTHRIKLSDTMPITYDWGCTCNWTTKTLRYLFGGYNRHPDKCNDGNIPATDFSISSLKMYNDQDHDFTTDVPFIDAPNADYSCLYLKYSMCCWNYVKPLQKEAYFRVFINTRPDIPITAFGPETNGVTLYCSDTYWDSESWEIISDNGNIQGTQQTKRYYIAINKLGEIYYLNPDDNTSSYFYGARGCLKATRTQQFHQIDTPNNMQCCFGYKNQASWYRDRRYQSSSYTIISSDDYGYVAQLNKLVYVESIDPNPSLEASSFGWGISGTANTYPYMYTITSYNGGANPQYMFNTSRGKRFVVSDYDNVFRYGARIWTVNADPSVPPTYEDVTWGTPYSSDYTNYFQSTTDNGYIIISYAKGSTNVNVTQVIAYDVPNEPVSYYTVSGYSHSLCIDLTNYFIGVNRSISDHLSCDLYDMSTQTVAAIIDIPAPSTFVGFAGWKDHVYIRVDTNGTTQTYYYNIPSGILELTSINIPQMTLYNNDYNYYTHIQRSVPANGNVESCMVMLASNNNSNYSHWIFKDSDPTHPFQFLTNGVYDDDKNGSSYHNAKMKYCNNNKNLLLITGCQRQAIYDVGYILDHGAIPYLYRWRFLWTTANPSTEGFKATLYKDYIGYVCMDYVELNKTVDNVFYDYAHSRRLYFVPFQKSMFYRITGTTHTINSFHNPVQVGNIPTKFTFQITNRNVMPKTRIIYGWTLDQTNSSDPANSVTYIEDAVGMTPCQMGVSTFDYGSWEDAFFMPKPCMLNSDGTVAYYLNPDNYAEKEDGTPSDIADPTFDGNAMMEWPLLYYKFVPGSASGEGSFYIANGPVDETYKCWCNIDANGDIIEHFYTAIYNGTVDSNNVLRSISGVALTNANGAGDLDLLTDYAYAEANNQTSDHMWCTGLYCDEMVIDALLILMGKSTNVQSVFGNGCYVANATARDTHSTGEANTRGLFWGDISGTSSFVKVFGMENWYNFTARRIYGAGCSTNNDGPANQKFYYKLTYGTEDGSTRTGFDSWNGAGYILSTIIPPDGYDVERSVNAWNTKLGFDTCGFYPTATGTVAAGTGGPNMYLSDYYYRLCWQAFQMMTVGAAFNASNSTGIGSDQAGIFAYTEAGSGYRHAWWRGCNISCKPVANPTPPL